MEMEVSIHIILLILYLKHRNHLNSLPIRHAVPVPVLCLSKEQRKAMPKSARKSKQSGGYINRRNHRKTFNQANSTQTRSHFMLPCPLVCLFPPSTLCKQININALPALIFPTAELLIRK
jgi:hypothetical protein